MVNAKGKKKGPPYVEEPDYTYIVICDPWPGDKSGKDRSELYYKFIAAWVWFMLGKSDSGWPEVIFSVHTRTDVIVALPKEAVVTPILGAHLWSEFLTLNAATRRVSYVFQYNYRSNGEPSNHNWFEHFPNPIQKEPPPSIPFHVKYPYPKSHWAMPVELSCRDLALKLPQTRQRTPTPPPPEPSLFVPYQPHEHYTNLLEEEPTPEVPCSAEVIENHGVKTEPAALAQARLFVDKYDPYEEEDAALRLVKEEPTDHTIFHSVKEEVSDVKIKPEPSDISVKECPTLSNEPSLALQEAIARLQSMRHSQGSPQARLDSVLSTPDAAPPPIPRYERVKPEPQEAMIPPAVTSDSAVSHDPRIRHSLHLSTGVSPYTLGSSSSPSREHPALVKPEPVEISLTSVTTPVRNMKSVIKPINTQDKHSLHTDSENSRSAGPRLRGMSFKRIKQEDNFLSGDTKRIKTEQDH
ncbi:uncharacterized protein FIBRA_04927 [Fibroporia radiculosa]|uniref:Uncharacterized protein n=1 Tax=Fibroporia radiculosa TaxID=599839 RepID=J4GQ30_9APHY|nr:uncharacterized protein FIBRA_04927 [Fibroporia radiculosa]CCM02815.1 predicted protein [Fibroporia radiculosa]